MNITRRKKPRRTAKGSNPSHLKWVRGHECCVGPAGCGGKIEAAHVRRGTDGGMSKKPSDKWAIPLCSTHHAEQHSAGEQTFEKRHGFSMKATAETLWARSPHRDKEAA